MRTKMSGPESLELALVMKKKERKNDNWLFFTQLVQAYLIVSMDVWGLDRQVLIVNTQVKNQKLEVALNYNVFVIYCT